jgi:pimeloyl-ACP methyl ester carboxylesterase
MGWFQGFEAGLHAAGEVELFARTSGDPDKPPLLLLHGFPQTHVMWHRVAQRLAGDFSLVIPDLRGYGDSTKPGPAATPEADHALHSKRAWLGYFATAAEALALVYALNHFNLDLWLPALTLLSVFWEDGRKELELFSRAAKRAAEPGGMGQGARPSPNLFTND